MQKISSILATMACAAQMATPAIAAAPIVVDRHHFTIHGCTQDGFHLTYQFQMNMDRLAFENPEEKSREIREAVRRVTPAWSNSLHSITARKIQQGKHNPLKSLLSQLNELSKQFGGSSTEPNVWPVLSNGGQLARTGRCPTYV